MQPSRVMTSKDGAPSWLPCGRAPDAIDRKTGSAGNRHISCPLHRQSAKMEERRWHEKEKTGDDANDERGRVTWSFVSHKT
jgi:hypothetical protein